MGLCPLVRGILWGTKNPILSRTRREREIQNGLLPTFSSRFELHSESMYLSYSGFSAICVPFGSRAASPTGTCIAGGTVR